MNTVTPQTATAAQPAYVIAPPLAQVDLDLPGLDIAGLSAVLDVEDTEEQTPFISVMNSGSAGADLFDPAAVEAHLHQVELYAAGVRVLIDRLAAMQAGGAR